MIFVFLGLYIDVFRFFFLFIVVYDNDVFKYYSLRRRVEGGWEDVI